MRLGGVGINKGRRGICVSLGGVSVYRKMHGDESEVCTGC